MHFLLKDVFLGMKTKLKADASQRNFVHNDSELQCNFNFLWASSEMKNLET